MTVFQDTADVDAVFVPFLNTITSDPALKPKFRAANTSFKISFFNPEAFYVVDCTSDPIAVRSGEDAASAPADVDLTMSADDGHKFWLGDLNLMGALARRKVKPRGEVTKLMGLLPTLQQAFGIYRGFAEPKGLV